MKTMNKVLKAAGLAIAVLAGGPAARAADKEECASQSVGMFLTCVGGKLACLPPGPVGVFGCAIGQMVCVKSGYDAGRACTKSSSKSDKAAPATPGSKSDKAAPAGGDKGRAAGTPTGGGNAGPDKGPGRSGPGSPAGGAGVGRSGPDRSGPDRANPGRGGPDRGSPGRGSPDRSGPDRGTRR